MHQSVKNLAKDALLRYDVYMCALARRGIMSQATALGARMPEHMLCSMAGGETDVFIGGISSGVKPLEYLKTVICGRCGAYGRYQVYMTYMYFSFFLSRFLNGTGAFS